MSYEVEKIDRSVYNFLALLGDVGGFFGIVSSFFAYLRTLQSHNKAENLLASLLYLD